MNEGDRFFGPQGAPHMPGYPPYPPPQYLRPGPPRRRWPAITGAAAASGAVAATVAAVIATHIAADNAAPAVRTPAIVTVTAVPAPPAPPPPLPTAQADRQTCDGWRAAGEKMHAATKAQSVIPKGMTVIDQAVRGNPDWTAAVHRSAEFYRQAAELLAAGVAPGTSLALGQSAASMVAALRTLSTSYETFDPVNGNAYGVMHEASDEMDVRCERLHP